MGPMEIMENYMEFVENRVKSSKLMDFLRDKKNEDVITITLRILAIPITFMAYLGFIVGFVNFFTLFGISIAAMVSLIYEGWNPIVAILSVVTFNTVTVTFALVCMSHHITDKLPRGLNLQGWATMQIFAITLIIAAIAS